MIWTAGQHILRQCVSKALQKKLCYKQTHQCGFRLNNLRQRRAQYSKMEDKLDRRCRWVISTFVSSLPMMPNRCANFQKNYILLKQKYYVRIPCKVWHWYTIKTFQWVLISHSQLFQYLQWQMLSVQLPFKPWMTRQRNWKNFCWIFSSVLRRIPIKTYQFVSDTRTRTSYSHPLGFFLPLPLYLSRIPFLPTLLWTYEYLTMLYTRHVYT